MKRIVLLTLIVSGIIMTSCTKKTAEFVNNIPDNAILVASIHPGQIYDKGGISSLESIKNSVDDEFARALIENPSKSGLMIDEYAFVFAYLYEDEPVFAVIAGVDNKSDLEKTIRTADKNNELTFGNGEGFTYFMPEGDDVTLAWTDEVLLFTAFENCWEKEVRLAEIKRLLNLPKEEAITTMVDFKDFLGKMKDINIWVSSNELKPLLEKMGEEQQLTLPVNLYNNYAHLYCDFADGALYVNSETNFSDEVQKNIDQFLVMKEAIDPKLLEMAPAGNLLLAFGAGVELDKIKSLIDQFAPAEIDSVGAAVEQATGMSTQELWDALTGDFIIAVNGTEASASMPVEIFIGIGVDDAAIQEKLMGKMKDMAPVENQGDFFMINIQGNEIYSGIVNGVWVLTNSKGYNQTIKNGKLEKSLNDTRFKELASSPMAMYMNLNLSTYPSMIQSALGQSPQGSKISKYVSESFDCMLMTSANNKGNFTLETAKPNENSLYTLLRMSEIGQE
ncbi:MAG: DUF4836 family protein [Bacteroidota bacterium]